MRIPNSVCTAQQWRIHEIASDFTVEDVWALPTPGGPDDLHRLVEWFTSVYETDTEWVAETANKTVHAAMHIGWVPDDSGPGYHGRMAVLVKPNGLFGRVYMTMIVPFRYILVYPALLRLIARSWVHQAESPPA
ncbi:DUF2867 domain-containing protein [Nocardia sp. NBC_01377]|uniref:DUF2867 domain-containing protein n=1 Tax=Nocardia sp. NBC_01377 TaxID=2903595 RepID=UPI00324C7F49